MLLIPTTTTILLTWPYLPRLLLTLRLRLWKTRKSSSMVCVFVLCVISLLLVDDAVIYCSSSSNFLRNPRKIRLHCLTNWKQPKRKLRSSNVSSWLWRKGSAVAICRCWRRNAVWHWRQALKLIFGVFLRRCPVTRSVYHIGRETRLFLWALMNSLSASARASLFRLTLCPTIYDIAMRAFLISSLLPSSWMRYS